MNRVVLVLLAAACSEPTRLPANTCGNGVLDPGEDCELFSGETFGSGLTCAPAGTDHACHFTCDPMMPTAVQCPVGDACDPDGTCVASPGTCGNGVVDATEECDPTVPPASGTCGAPGSADACRFTCSASVTCPTGAACGRDGHCRVATGNLAIAPGSPFSTSPGAFSLADIDGDGNVDFVGTIGGVRVAFGVGDGSFRAPLSFPVSTLAATVGDVTGDGRADVSVLQSGTAMGVLVGESIATIDQVPFATFEQPLPGGADLWVGMRADPARPFQELLHVAIAPTTVRVGFDQPGVGGTSPDPDAVIESETTQLEPSGPPVFSIADAIDDPATGADEIAIGTPGSDAVHIFTATTTGAAAVAKLVHDQDIALPGSLIALPPLFADVDGDGHLDVIASISTAASGFEVVVAFGNGHTFAAPTLDQALTSNNCFPTAAANVVGDAQAELWCGRLLQRTGQLTMQELLPFVNGNGEAVFADLNHDGVLDVVVDSRIPQGLTVFFGAANGTFSEDFVPTANAIFNLRVGDFDGDRTDDILFGQSRVGGDDDVLVLYGSPAGLGAPVVTTADIDGFGEPVLFDADQLPAGSIADGTTDIVVTNVDADDDDVGLLVGAATRAPQSLGFAPPHQIGVPPLSGTFTLGAPGELLLVAQQIGVAELDILQVPTDNFVPTCEPPTTRTVTVAALGDASTFGVVSPACGTTAAVLAADVDTQTDPGIEEVVAVQTVDAQTCALLQSARLLVMHTSADDSSAPIAVAIAPLAGPILHTHAVDVDGDGNLDIVIVFEGDPSTCVVGDDTCTPLGNGTAVLWGTPTGPDGSVSIAPAVGSGLDGAVTDAIALHLDGGTARALVASTQLHLFVYDVGPAPARALTSRAVPLVTYSQASGVTQPPTELAVADLNGDGLEDLVLGQQFSAVTALLSVSEAPH